MKLLHLFSNHKLTGPAEPALRLVAELAKRGHEVVLAHALPADKNAGQVGARAAEYALTTATQFRLCKHFNPVAIWRDARLLAAFIDERRFDIVHCNMVNDHLTAALATRRSAHKPRLVRTNHDAVPMKRSLRNRFLFPGRADALIELSKAARDADVHTFGMGDTLRQGVPAVHLVDTAVDLARLDPARQTPDLRTKLGLSANDFVVGIAARIQRRRRFRVLLDAAAIARRSVPNLRLLIIGRGTHKESVAVEPARRRGLDDIVVFPGYLRGDEYVGGLSALDVKVFLVPGTDGSCRAMREAMALGRPVIAARRGMLPELVTDGLDGLVIDDTAENLASAIIRLAQDRELCRSMGEAARRTALARFDPAKQAEQVERIYTQLL